MNYDGQCHSGLITPAFKLLHQLVQLFAKLVAFRIRDVVVVGDHGVYKYRVEEREADDAARDEYQHEIDGF